MQGSAVPQDREGIAAETIAGRLDHRERNGRGKGRIDRIPAGEQHPQTGHRREGLRCRDDIAGKDRRAA